MVKVSDKHRYITVRSIGDMNYQSLSHATIVSNAKPKRTKFNQPQKDMKRVHRGGLVFSVRHEMVHSVPLMTMKLNESAEAQWHGPVCGALT